MSILVVNRLSKAYAGTSTLKNVSFSIEKGEKIGIVGKNGSGKTTLLRLINGQENYEEGSISFGKNIKIGFSEQLPVFDAQTTIIEIVMEAFKDIYDLRRQIEIIEKEISQENRNKEQEILLNNYGEILERYEKIGGFSCESRIKGIILGLGFPESDFTKKVSLLSGGEKTRIALACTLCRELDIVFLDEPTNNLDLQAVEWLENYLLNYQGAVVIVSHDRYFLDKCVTRILEIENNLLYDYKGNYSRFLLLKQERLLIEERQFQKNKEKIEKIEAYILKYKAGIKSKQARGRQSMLNRMERLEGPAGQNKIFLQQKIIERSGDMVLRMEKINYSINENCLLNNISLEVQRGERIGIVGKNGTGKTSLLKIISGINRSFAGQITFGSKIKLAYFDQEHQHLNKENTLFEELIKNYDLTKEEVRSKLAMVGFREDDVEKRISQLSGGERTRLGLLKIILEQANLILFDEPTNNLDIESVEILENFIQNYEGTLLIVSHDRFFLDNTITKIWELENKRITQYLGDYSYYKDKKKILEENVQEQTKQASKKSEKESKPKEKGVNRFKLSQSREKLEMKIEEREKELTELNEKMKDTELFKSIEGKIVSEKVACIQSELKDLYEKWEEVTIVLEN